MNTINIDSVFHHSRQLKKIEKFYITHEDTNNLKNLIVQFSAWGRGVWEWGRVEPPTTFPKRGSLTVHQFLEGS